MSFFAFSQSSGSDLGQMFCCRLGIIWGKVYEDLFGNLDVGPIYSILGQINVISPAFQDVTANVTVLTL